MQAEVIDVDEMVMEAASGGPAEVAMGAGDAPLPSLDVVAGAVTAQLADYSSHSEGLDNKAGAVLGVAGLLAGLIAARHGVIAKVGLVADVLAGVFAVVAFMPRRSPVFRARQLRSYVGKDEQETVLRMLDTRIVMVEQVADSVRVKGRWLRVAMVMLLIAVALLAADALA